MRQQHPTRKRREPGHRGSGRKAPVRLGPEAQEKIGNQLRAMYDDVVKQGVPDRFADLLNQLDRPKGKSKG